MKYYLISLMLMFPVYYGNSQSIQDCLWLQKEGQFRSTINCFNDIISQKPANDTALFYLGDTYFKMGRYDSAEIVYRKIGAIGDNNPFFLVGLGKTYLVKKNKAQATESFDKARKITRRDVMLYVSIIDGCLSPDVMDTVMARTYIEYANKVNSSSPQFFIKNAVPFFIKLGEMYFIQENLGKAANSYESAIYYDKACSEAFVKLGILYTSANNFPQAYEAFSKAIEVEPGLILAYKYFGDLNYTHGNYADAEQAYSTYMSRAESSLEDMERYALILFFSKKYEKADSVIQEVIKIQANDPVLYRIGGYIAYETGEYQKGLDYMNEFFKIQTKDKILASDYEYFGNLLLKEGQDSLGVMNLEKAIEMDTTKVFYYDQFAKLYSDKNEHPKAIKYYRLVKTSNPQESLNVKYNLGREYFFFANQYKRIYDSLTLKEEELKIIDEGKQVYRDRYEKYFVQADSCFEKVAELSPKSYLGYFWRARSLSYLDLEFLTDSTKIQYEKVLSIVESGDQTRNKSVIIECYRYFGSYYYYKSDRELKSDPAASREDKKSAKTYFEKIIELDPTDQQAITVLGILNQKN